MEMTNNQPTAAAPARFDVVEGEIPVISIAGSLADEANFQAKEVFLRLIGEKPSRILVDLSGMDYISSSGIGLLVSVLRRCRQFGISMSLCGLQPEVFELFKLTRLNQVFEIIETRPGK
jgi:anti-anti-sigma factor